MAGKELKKIKNLNKLIKLLIKTERIEAIAAKIVLYTDSNCYQQKGEEIHYIIEGEIQYDPREKVYLLKK